MIERSVNVQMSVLTKHNMKESKGSETLVFFLLGTRACVCVCQLSKAFPDAASLHLVTRPQNAIKGQWSQTARNNRKYTSIKIWDMISCVCVSHCVVFRRVLMSLQHLDSVSRSHPFQLLYCQVPEFLHTHTLNYLSVYLLSSMELKT